MTCRVCGATIADKAIVCYRCGAPTAQAPSARGAAARSGRRRSPLGALVLLVLGFAALAAGWILPAGQDLAGEILLGAGAGLVVLGGVRLLVRRR